MQMLFSIEKAVQKRPTKGKTRVKPDFPHLLHFCYRSYRTRVLYVSDTTTRGRPRSRYYLEPLQDGLDNRSLSSLSSP